MKLIKYFVKKALTVVSKITKTSLYKNIFQLYIKSQLKSYGHGVFFQKYVVIENPQYVDIGKNVSIGAFVHIWGKGTIKIGDNVLIGSHTAIVSETHDYNETIMFNTNICKPIIIEDNVWIGTHCVIMPGVTIKNGSVIGAGSIVTSDTETDGIYIGAPAKLHKYRI